jgi:hypothetical protein
LIAQSASFDQSIAGNSGAFFMASALSPQTKKGEAKGLAKQVLDLNRNKEVYDRHR